jgi:predicted RNase H-like HicB family nuclease
MLITPPFLRSFRRSVVQIPILIEPITGKRYRARGAEPFALSAEGATREEALTNLKEQLAARLKNGTALVALEVPTEPHPLAAFAGMFKDDPCFEEVVAIMAANRRKMDRDPKAP